MVVPRLIKHTIIVIPLKTQSIAKLLLKDTGPELKKNTKRSKAIHHLHRRTDDTGSSRGGLIYAAMRCPNAFMEGCVFSLV